MPESEGRAQRDAFFHNSVGISDWMKERIADALESRGYTVVVARVEAEVMTRMSKVTVISSVTVQFKGSDGKEYALNDYSSINRDYDGSKNTRWLVDAIKELEMEAVLKFGGKALKTQVDEDYEPKSVNVDAAVPKNTDDIKQTYYFSADVKEMVGFLTDREFIERWSFGSARFEGDAVVLDGLTLSNIRSRDAVITMDYKWGGWAASSRVEITVVQIGGNAQVTLVQRGIPVASVDIVKRHWHERIFSVISQLFNCPIKSV